MKNQTRTCFELVHFKMDSHTIEIANLCVELLSQNDSPDHLGLGVNEMFEILSQNPQLSFRLSYSDLFSALCSSVESTQLFQLVKADDSDFYFKLRKSKEDSIQYLSEIAPILLPNVEEYQIPQEQHQTPTFDKFVDDMKNVIRNHNSLIQRNEELERAQNEIQIQLLSISNQAMMKQQILNCNELIRRLNQEPQQN